MYILRQVLIIPLVALVKVYQWGLKPMFRANACRFAPTCSEYMIEALKVHGPFRGLWLGIRRIGRCHPWGGHGWDPVPPKSKPKNRKHYLMMVCEGLWGKSHSR